MKGKRKVICFIISIFLILVSSYFIASFARKSQNIEEKKIVGKEEKIFRVGNKVINFKLYRVNQAFFLKVPDNFVKLDSVTLNQKYGVSNRPELVFQSEDDNTHTFVTMGNMVMTDEVLSDFIENKKRELTDFHLKDASVYQRYGKIFGRICATEQKADGKFYDIRYFTLNDKLVTVEFNTLKENENIWKDVSEEILASICFQEGDTKKK